MFFVVLTNHFVPKKKKNGTKFCTHSRFLFSFFLQSCALNRYCHDLKKKKKKTKSWLKMNLMNLKKKAKRCIFFEYLLCISSLITKSASVRTHLSKEE